MGKDVLKMGVERVDYGNEDEYQQALQEEHNILDQHPQYHEPDVVPCFECGCQMYWESSYPEGNLCSNCKRPKYI